MKKKHEHSGRSSEGYLDASVILSAIDLKEGENVVDAGCGRGYISLEAARIIGPKARVLAIEIHEGAINELRERLEANGLENLDTVHGDATRDLPVGDGTIDVFLMVKVFHGFFINEELDSITDEIHRILTKDGRIGILENVERWDAPDPDDKEPEDVGTVMSRYGFKLQAIRPVSDDHVIGILTR